MIEQRPGTIFVGRERELQELIQGLDDARAGRGRLYLLAGEPGIGKSTLADELATRARERGARVLWGKGWEEAGAPAYWPWVQALRSYLRSADPERIRVELGHGAADIAQMLPEIADIVPDLSPPPASDPESARFRLFDSAAAFLINAARSTALVMVIDDLHAADTPSVRFLRFLASQLADSRILVVATYRDVELTPDHPLTADLSEVLREPITRLLPVTGLGERAVGEFIEAASGQELRSQQVTVLWRETGGNPLFLGEAVRLLSAEGRSLESLDASLLRVAVPPGVRDVITRRVQQLEAGALEALTTAAVLGPEFSIDSLRSVAEYSVEQVLDLLDGPMQAGLLIAVAGTRGRLRFSHDLVRETLYGDLSPARRVRLHRRVARALEAYYGASADAHLAELAHHFFEAAPGGDALRAVDYARRAGEEAVRALAYEEAVRFYGLALQAFELAATDDEKLHTELLLAVGDAQARAGNLEQARAMFLRAAGLAQRIGAADLLARAALGYGGRFIWARAGNDPHTIPLLQDALVMLGGSDDQLRVRLLTRLACALRSSPDRGRSDALSQQAVEMARQIGDLPTLSYALEGRFGAIWWPENPEERLAIAREAIEIAKQTGDLERESTARMGAQGALADLCRMDEARAEAEILARRAGELRQPAQRWLAGAIRSWQVLFDGHFGDAEPLILAGLGLESHPTLVADDVSSARMQRFLLRRDQDRLGEMEEMVRSSVDEFPWYPVHRCALALLLVDVGRTSEARNLFDDLARDEFAALYRDNEWLLGMALASEVSARLHDASAAAVLYDQLLPFAGRHAIGHVEGAMGAVDRYLGLLAETMGSLADAKKHLADAIALNQRMGGRPWTARSQYDLARILLSEGPVSGGEAEALLRSALQIAREVGMVALEQPIESLLGPTSPRREGDPAAASSGRGVFQREGEYWTIAFDADSFRIRDAKGMRYLARLLANPGQEQHALDLASMGNSNGRASADDPRLTTAGFGDAGPRLDADARGAYRDRLRELDEEVHEAERHNDPERLARARQEMDFLARELSASVGLGGRDRKAGSAAERARISVTRAIRASLRRIAEQSPTLGRHFTATIRTGTYCSYNPDPRVPMSWRV